MPPRRRGAASRDSRRHIPPQPQLRPRAGNFGPARPTPTPRAPRNFPRPPGPPARDLAGNRAGKGRKGREWGGGKGARNFLIIYLKSTAVGGRLRRRAAARARGGRRAGLRRCRSGLSPRLPAATFPARRVSGSTGRFGSGSLFPPSPPPPPPHLCFGVVSGEGGYLGRGGGGGVPPPERARREPRSAAEPGWGCPPRRSREREGRGRGKGEGKGGG